jgi:VWFA-related protein
MERDFEIYEEGSLQPIERFESTEAPFSLLLLLDVSGSTKSYMNMIKDASIQFTQEIKTNDRVAVATFNSKTSLVHDFTNDRASIRSAIGRIRSGGGTAFYDALDRSIRDYMDGVEGRKAIVVFSDGVDNQLTGDFGSGSRTTFSDLYREIQEADTLIYTIFLDTEGQQGTSRGGMRRGGLGGILGDIIFKGPTIGIPGGGWDHDQAYAQARKELELIADHTGGRMYAPRVTSDLIHVYSEIADDLRVQYTLGYYSQNAANNGQWREIEVKIIDRPDLAVRARRGYYGRRG